MDLLLLLGGLALFLYGMQMMSAGLEMAAGNRMKHILERLTANRYLGVLVGAAITALIQSSSAMTVMVVGFVSSGMMTLNQAVWLIMGANIGTTITGQLIALDIGAIAPLLAFVGVVLVVFIKRASIRHYGQIIAGLGVLFIGMGMMSDAMKPLHDSEAFTTAMTRFQNPFLGILVGALFTAVIQSSSASIGILQALALSGAIGLSSAVYILFGQNIGTCITALLASVGTTRNAKRATVIHLLFNIIGTAIFTALAILTPLTDMVAGLTPQNVAAQIANMHTIFNITTTVLLLPFGNLLAKLATRILPEREAEVSEGHRLLYIPPLDSKAEYRIGHSALAVNGVRRELMRMAEMTEENISACFLAIEDMKASEFQEMEKKEEYLDYLNLEIAKHISRWIAYETNEENSTKFSAYFKIAADLERIGDHSINLCGYTSRLKEKGIAFSEAACGEIRAMRTICMRAMSFIRDIDTMSTERLNELNAIEEEFDGMTEAYRQNQLERLQSGKCSDEACILYSEMLTDFERIGDHILNIGQALAGKYESR